MSPCDDMDGGLKMFHSAFNNLHVALFQHRCSQAQYNTQQCKIITLLVFVSIKKLLLKDILLLKVKYLNRSRPRFSSLHIKHTRFIFLGNFSEDFDSIRLS